MNTIFLVSSYIDNLECSQEFSERNFALAKTKDKQGKERRSFNITKDGFTTPNP